MATASTKRGARTYATSAKGNRKYQRNSTGSDQNGPATNCTPPSKKNSCLTESSIEGGFSNTLRRPNPTQIRSASQYGGTMRVIRLAANAANENCADPCARTRL